MTALELALRYAPCIHMDRADPIPLRAIGYTIFRESARSASFPERIVEVPAGTAFAIEYACFFTYDIGHMYDLEHVWVWIAKDGTVLDAQGSFHGKYLNALLPGFPGFRPPENGHVHVFCQPGKHAFLASGEMTRLFPGWKSCCKKAEGGVLVGGPFSARFTKEGRDLYSPTEADHRNSSRWLREHLSFTPSLDFTDAFVPDASLFMPWNQLFENIPVWITEECERLRIFYKDGTADCSGTDRLLR